MEESIPSSFFFVMSLSHHIRASRKNITDHLINTLETEVEGKIVSFFQLFLFVCLLVSFLGGGGGGREEFFVVVLNLKFKARFLSFFFYFFFKIFFFQYRISSLFFVWFFFLSAVFTVDWGFFSFHLPFFSATILLCRFLYISPKQNSSHKKEKMRRWMRRERGGEGESGKAKWFGN